MAGLLDQYEQRGSIQAMDVLLKMASYLHQRIASLREKRGIAWWAECLKVEFGGMNEASVSLLHLHHCSLGNVPELQPVHALLPGRLLPVRHNRRSAAQTAWRLVLQV